MHNKKQEAIDLFNKNFKKNLKHKRQCVNKSGLVVNTSWPHLGASPDGVRNCECCGKRIVVGELASTCLKNADLIIYTDNGILVIEVQFNVEFRKVMPKKNYRFYIGYMIPELLT